MPPDRGGSGDEPKIRRALSQDLSDNLLDSQSRIAKTLGLEEDLFGRDARVFAIKNWEIENAFRDELFANPTLRSNPWFLHQWNTFRDAEVALSLGSKTDVLSFMSMINPERENETRFVPGEDLSPGERYFRYFEDLGPDRSGQLEEVVGSMGSGKSNFLAWKVVRALARGSHVFANFAVAGDEGMARFHQVHRLSQLVLETVQLRRTGFDGLAYWVIDEQGANLGGASRTTSTLEGRWATAILTKSRKLGVFLTRARQQDNVPTEQLRWVAIMIRKDVRSPEIVRGSYLQGERRGEQFSFSIKSMATAFDTKAMATFSYDLDVEAMDAWISRHEAEGADDGYALSLMERYARASLEGRDLLQEELKEERVRPPPPTIQPDGGLPPSEVRPVAGEGPPGVPEGLARRPPIDAECPHCHNQWTYRGQAISGKCTMCGHYFRIRSAETGLKGVDELIERAMDAGSRIYKWRKDGGPPARVRSMTKLLAEAKGAIGEGRLREASRVLARLESYASRWGCPE